MPAVGWWDILTDAPALRHTCYHKGDRDTYPFSMCDANTWLFQALVTKVQSIHFINDNSKANSLYSVKQHTLQNSDRIPQGDNSIMLFRNKLIPVQQRIILVSRVVLIQDGVNYWHGVLRSIWLCSVELHSSCACSTGFADIVHRNWWDRFCTI